MTRSSNDLAAHAEERLYAYYRRKEEAMKRVPIRPEGPRSTLQPHHPQVDPESRIPTSTRRVPRATQSLPERMLPEREYFREKPEQYREQYRVSDDDDEDDVYDEVEDDYYNNSNHQGNVKGLDPAGLTAAASSRASQLQEQILRQRSPISPERRRPQRKPQVIGARVSHESPPSPETKAPIKSPPSPKREEQEPMRQKKQKKKLVGKSRKEDHYDQFSTQESTSGFSLFSDKYRIIGASKSKNSASTTPRANLDKSVKRVQPQGSSGAQIGEGQFMTPVGAVAGFDDTVIGVMPINRQEPLVLDSCFEDFVHTMILPLPDAPEMLEQEATNQGNDAALVAHEVDGCGSILFDTKEEPDDIETIVKKDWYDERQESLAKDSFVKDFIHTMWSCS